MNTLVFVYGTLKKGCANFHVLSGRYPGNDASKQFPAKFIAKGTIAGRIYSLGSFPGLKDAVDEKVYGELYEVDEPTLARLDRLEGHPKFYERKQVPVNFQGEPNHNGEYLAWAYFYNGDVDNKHYIRSGVW